MLVLALDTTTRQGSVALARDGGVVAVHAGDAAITHGERLPGDLMRLFDAHDLRVATSICLPSRRARDRSPDSASASRQCRGSHSRNSKPLAGISALDAIHDSASRPQPSALSPQLSRRSRASGWTQDGGQVFSAIYKNGEVVEPALVDTPAEILARWAQRGDARRTVCRRRRARLSRPHSRCGPGCADCRAGAAACAKHRAAGRAAHAPARAVCT